MTCLIELHCLPSIAYFSCLSACDTVVLERQEHFIKQTFRNRYVINTTQGPERLVIPVKARHGKPMIHEVVIDYSQKWLNNHIRAIESAYRKAPFYEHYADELFAVLYRKPHFLYDLNLELLTICLKWLKLGIMVRETLSYEKAPAADLVDLRNVIDAKNPDRYAHLFTPVPYHQVFGKGFVSRLSLLDLVMCEGPNAIGIVRGSSRVMNK